MTKEMIAGFSPVDMQEAAFVIGGLDKRAQDALYTIGYVVGVIVRLFAKIIAWF